MQGYDPRLIKLRMNSIKKGVPIQVYEGTDQLFQLSTGFISINLLTKKNRQNMP